MSGRGSSGGEDVKRLGGGKRKEGWEAGCGYWGMRVKTIGSGVRVFGVFGVGI